MAKPRKTTKKTKAKPKAKAKPKPKTRAPMRAAKAKTKPKTKPKRATKPKATRGSSKSPLAPALDAWTDLNAPTLDQPIGGDDD